MHTENAILDNGCQRHAIKGVTKALPELDIVMMLALIIEAIHAADVCTLMIASKHEEALGVFDLIGEEEADSCELLLPPVNIVTEEEEV
jgi:hypothetical protein